MQIGPALLAFFSAALAAPVPNPDNLFDRRQLAIARASDGSEHTLINGPGIIPTPDVGEIGDAIYEDAEGVHIWDREEYDVLHRRQLAIIRESDGAERTFISGTEITPAPDVGEIGDAVYVDASGYHTRIRKEYDVLHRRQLAVIRDSDGSEHTFISGTEVLPTPGAGEIGDAIYEDAEGVHIWDREEYDVLHRRQLAVTRGSDGAERAFLNGADILPTPHVGEIGDAIYEDADGVHIWDNDGN
ncbi:hypothetical protein DL89DRAFT_263638 [Linderina pennispora]|uniref:Uncharacterized protein n=1 Tax=Linderina pennispora TaxID=61395 RepID=A0A1Y1WJC5_9FUNG|nr:uncharacterized protein DL89DRAFT_263638 [Linderina pennispora]ORX73593.1 hypothetical protein DL89DRAFT_263638 [Linderina pennispora]